MYSILELTLSIVWCHGQWKFICLNQKNTFPNVIKMTTLEDPWLWPFLMIGIGGTIIPIVYSVACHFLVRYLTQWHLHFCYTSNVVGVLPSYRIRQISRRGLKHGCCWRHILQLVECRYVMAKWSHTRWLTYIAGSSVLDFFLGTILFVWNSSESCPVKDTSSNAMPQSRNSVDWRYNTSETLG